MTPSRLYLYNTMTRRKEIFTPGEKGGQVKMFTCGPSIYSWQHIGNYRTFLFEDVLQRYLEYRGCQVKRLLNFTDVEDKAVREANSRGISLEALTRPVADRFMEDCRILNIKLNAPIPRASTSIDQAVVLIKRLIEQGYAYRHGKDIFYDPLKFKGFGKLYGLDMNRWPKKKVRFYKDTYPGRRWNFGDFILWKGRRKTDGDIYWETPLGEGRPSWNIQDPAIITKNLGYSVDISCGGVDNLYRHHDYNIAVIEAASGHEFSRYWLHGELVLVNGRKMSKSKGNIVYLQDLASLGYQPHHLRFFLIHEHYRSQLDLNEDKLHLARGKIDAFRETIRQLDNSSKLSRNPDHSADEWIEKMTAGFESRMDDDLDVKGAFETVFTAVSKLALIKANGGLDRKHEELIKERLVRIDSVLQVLGQSQQAEKPENDR